MIFSSYRFLIFLAVVFAGFRALNGLGDKRFAKIWLILSSFYFYAQGSLSFLPYFIFTVFFNFIIGSSLVKTKSKVKRRMLLSLGLLENLVLLGYFKYIDFFIENYNYIFSSNHDLLKIALPIGISFFTFQLIAYIVDCYRGETEEYSLINYLLFITFFPQLIVGPIIHHMEVVPQFESKESGLFNVKNISLGLFIFAIGCAKKVLIADPLTAFAQGFYDHVYSASIFEAHFSVLAYTFSYYFDLSGYADMAIGLGLFFNIHLPQNFNSPYKSRNFRDYWRRWHMSLSKFLSDYIFKSVFKRGDGAPKFYLAVMLTFIVSGFWHGAGWRFVFWGVLNGIFVCGAHFMSRRKWELPFYLAWFMTFIGIVVTRIIFVSSSLSEALYVMMKTIDFSVFSGWAKSAILMEGLSFVVSNAYVIFVLILSMAIAFFFKNTSQLQSNFEFNKRHAIVTGILITLSLFQMSNVADFLYFQF